MIRNGSDTEARQSLVRRVLESPGLRRAEKLGRLLVCLSEHPEGAALTEKDLAARLFPRPPGHDTTDDSIVRVSVRQLRFKLHEYFSGPGAHEPCIIEIPKGEYTLHFVERKVEPLLTDTPPPPPPVQTLPRSIGFWSLVTVAAIGLGALAGYSAAHRTMAAGAQPPRNLLVRAMDGGRYSLTIVPGDAALRTLVLLPGASEPSISKYLNGDAEPPGLPADDMAGRMVSFLATSRLVTAPHAAVAASLFGSVGDLRTRAAVRHPREVNVRALQQNSHAFLAARLMNPIVDLFEPKLTLRCDNEAPNRRIGIVDTLTKGNEPKRYGAYEPRDQRSFARIALLPNLGADGGRVLLLSGMGAVGTEAAALVASDPQWLRTIEERLPPGQIYFEALLESGAANGMPVDIKLKIVRSVQPFP